MQTQPCPPQENDSDRSSFSEEVSSEFSSYGEKVSSQVMTCKINNVLPSNTREFNDLSTTNFNFQIEESFLPQSIVPDKHLSISNQPQFKDSPSQKSTNLNDQIDDLLDLKELLKLLEDNKQQEKYSYQNNHECSSQKPKTNRLRQDKVQNHNKKTQSPKNRDIVKKTNNFLRPFNQEENSQCFGFHQSNLSAQTHMPFQSFYHPPNWNNWQQYPKIDLFQRPLFHNPLKISTTTKSYREEFASQNFMIWNVLISIKLCSFLSLKKNVLLAPFSSSNLDDKISRVITKRLKYDIKQILYVQASKNNQQQVQDGYVFSVKAKGLQKNYRGIYFVKSPTLNWHEQMKYYSLGMLKQSVKRIFELVHQHMEESIVFPDFEWGSLTKNELCENLILSIFREINEQKKNYRCTPLREVVISLNNSQNFENYRQWLRFYAKQVRS